MHAVKGNVCGKEPIRDQGSEICKQTPSQLLTPAQQQKNQLGKKGEAWTHSETLTLLAGRLGAILLSATYNER